MSTVEVESAEVAAAEAMKSLTIVECLEIALRAMQAAPNEEGSGELNSPHTQAGLYNVQQALAEEVIRAAHKLKIEALARLGCLINSGQILVTPQKRPKPKRNRSGREN